MIPEQKATGETAVLYHDIKQTLRASGVKEVFWVWASYPRFFPAMWEAMRPNAGTRAFEAAADRLRAEAVAAADKLGRLGVLAQARLGPSQAYQAQAALMLYHYLNPKLQLFVSAVSLALQEAPGTDQEPAPGAPELIERGIPPKMSAMDFMEERPQDHALRGLFKDIRRALGLPAVDLDYRTLALWPTYLDAAWQRLKPLIAAEGYGKAVQDLIKLSRNMARELPYPVKIPGSQLRQDGEDMDGVVQATEAFQQFLAPLLLNISLLAMDWKTPEELKDSPFPAKTLAPEEARQEA